MVVGILSKVMFMLKTVLKLGTTGLTSAWTTAAFVNQTWAETTLFRRLKKSLTKLTLMAMVQSTELNSSITRTRSDLNTMSPLWTLMKRPNCSMLWLTTTKVTRAQTAMIPKMRTTACLNSMNLWITSTITSSLTMALLMLCLMLMESFQL